jgi:hypothetical protein
MLTAFKQSKPYLNARGLVCQQRIFSSFFPSQSSTMSKLKSIQDPRVQAVLSNVDRKFHKSPDAWEDQLMYFLLPDRFSDGNERGYRNLANKLVNTGTTPLFSKADRGNAIDASDERNKWLNAGGKFIGGKIKAIVSKLGYLKRMGVTTLWIGPIFKQIADLETYHGYGIQDFLDVDPRFGTREDLNELVQAAHAAGIYVLLDVVLNHAGDVFGYKDYSAHWDGTTHEVRGFWDGERNSNNMIPLGPVDENKYPDAWPNGAIWPAELQNAGSFSRKGTIRDFDAKPEFLEGDFFGLKSFNLGAYDPKEFTPTSALQTLTECFKFWIAFADLDGFRVVSQTLPKYAHCLAC